MKTVFEKMKDEIHKKFNDDYSEEGCQYRRGLSTCIHIINEFAEEYKPKTNADKIRSMSDEELADMLHNIGSYVENGEPLIDIYIGEDKTTIDDSFGFILEWLMAERV